MATFTSTKIDPSLTGAEKKREFGLYKDSFLYSLGAFLSQGKNLALLAIVFDIMAKQFSSVQITKTVYGRKGFAI